ncbi:DNA alkylation repair protein [Haloechinothrix halophila]|uniref:DNA alkylation repair protein n=1 Tax=Haloechinothrix halophila TaxID=1069073 RepID=UPI000556CB85|nr:DNA alkylation repair protein [Haloechinothrix halophila]
MSTARAVADELDDRLRAVARPERADGERRYLKSDLEHLGVSVPEIRKVATAVHRERPDLTHDELVMLVEALWEQPVHERRMLAAELLDLANTALSANDVPLLERLLRESHTWALVDPVAIRVVGTLVERDPQAWDPIVRRWASDADMWLRRASLLVHLPQLRRGAGDVDRFTEIADELLDEREFFIRKAIGWVLRETGKQRPDLVTEWLRPRAARAAGVTVREAVKHLPEEHRERVLAARPRRSRES